MATEKIIYEETKLNKAMLLIKTNKLEKYLSVSFTVRLVLTNNKLITL